MCINAVKTLRCSSWYLSFYNILDILLRWHQILVTVFSCAPVQLLAANSDWTKLMDVCIPKVSLLVSFVSLRVLEGNNWGGWEKGSSFSIKTAYICILGLPLLNPKAVHNFRCKSIILVSKKRTINNYSKYIITVFRQQLNIFVIACYHCSV